MTEKYPPTKLIELCDSAGEEKLTRISDSGFWLHRNELVSW